MSEAINSLDRWDSTAGLNPHIFMILIRFAQRETTSFISKHVKPPTMLGLDYPGQYALLMASQCILSINGVDLLSIIYSNTQPAWVWHCDENGLTLRRISLSMYKTLALVPSMKLWLSGSVMDPETPKNSISLLVFIKASFWNKLRLLKSLSIWTIWTSC